MEGDGHGDGDVEDGVGRIQNRERSYHGGEADDGRRGRRWSRCCMSLGRDAGQWRGGDVSVKRDVVCGMGRVVGAGAREEWVRVRGCG